MLDWINQLKLDYQMLLLDYDKLVKENKELEDKVEQLEGNLAATERILDHQEKYFTYLNERDTTQSIEIAQVKSNLVLLKERVRRLEDEK